MFSKVAILATLSVALSVAAAPGGGDKYQCNTGAAYCCNELHDTKSATKAETKAIIAAIGQGVTGQFSENCSPISVIGAGSGASCTQQPVCCERNHMNGLVVVGCTPINVSA